MPEGDKCDGKKIKQGKGNVECQHVEVVMVLDNMAPVSLRIIFVSF